MEQYANDRGPGQKVRRAKPPETETLLAFGRLTEANTFKYLETHKISQISGVWIILYLMFQK